jgi:hypothetical protein
MAIGAIPSTGLQGVTGTALGGLKRAEQQLAQAAQATARFGATSGTPMPDPAPETAAALLAAQEAAPDLAGATVQALMAKQAYAANLAVVRTADEMQGDLVNRLG